MMCQDRKAAALPTASAAGAGRRPAYPCAGLSARARTPSQAPLGWGRVPPCTGPRRAGLPKQAFKTVRLIASLPRKGVDKEAGRSARAPAPEVALLLPAQAQSGAPLRASLHKGKGVRGVPLTLPFPQRAFPPLHCSPLAARRPPGNVSPASYPSVLPCPTSSTARPQRAAVSVLLLDVVPLRLA